MDYTYEQIAKMIDHSVLDPATTDLELEEGCRIALTHNVATLCVKPYWLRQAVARLKGSSVKPTVTVGFPHGAHTTAIKVAETRVAVQDGALELDMVVNVGKVLSGDWIYVTRDIAEVVNEAHAGGALAKVIFENCYLKNEHKIALCEICAEVKADFVKTSTGFGAGGATFDDLKLMRAHSPARVQVKAAGGVRTLDQLLAIRALGVTRVGTRATVAILEECRQRATNEKQTTKTSRRPSRRKKHKVL